MAVILTPKLTLRLRTPANHRALINPNSGLSLQHHQSHYLLENTPTTIMLYRFYRFESLSAWGGKFLQTPSFGGKSSWVPPGMLHLTGVLSSWVREASAWRWGNFQVVQWCHESISYFHGHEKGFSTDFTMDWFKIQPKPFLLVWRWVLMKCPLVHLWKLYENHTNSICGGTAQPHLPHYLQDPQSPTVTFSGFKTAQFPHHDCNLHIAEN